MAEFGGMDHESTGPPDNRMVKVSSNGLPMMDLKPVREPTARTIFQHGGPNHLGLW